MTTDGRIVLAEPNGSGSARLVLDAAGLLGPSDASRANRELLRDRHAVVVDDDAGIRQTVSTVLERMECHCTICVDGAEAMQVINSKAPVDLVVSDIVMPFHDGYEIFDAAKKRDPDLPVVLITGFGYDPSHTVVRAAERGLEGVLLKPFSARQLIERIGDAMRCHLPRSSQLLIPTAEQVTPGRLLPLADIHEFVMASSADGARFEMVPSGAIFGDDEPLRVPAPSLGERVSVRPFVGCILAESLPRTSTENAPILGFALGLDGRLEGPTPNAGGRGRRGLVAFGPLLVTAEEVSGSSISIKLTCEDGEIGFETSIESICESISRIASVMPLRAGTIVGIGPEKRVTLAAASTVAVQGAQLGRLNNPIVHEED